MQLLEIKKGFIFLTLALPIFARYKVATHSVFPKDRGLQRLPKDWMLNPGSIIFTMNLYQKHSMDYTSLLLRLNLLVTFLESRWDNLKRFRVQNGLWTTYQVSLTWSSHLLWSTTLDVLSGGIQDCSYLYWQLQRWSFPLFTPGFPSSPWMILSFLLSWFSVLLIPPHLTVPTYPIHFVLLHCRVPLLILPSM